MCDSWFWRAAACVGLLAALSHVATRIASPSPVHAQAGGVIEVAERDGEQARLFLIDTSRKVILVYGGAARFKFSLLAARYYDKDVQATVGCEWPFKPTGYSILEMDRYLRKTSARRP